MSEHSKEPLKRSIPFARVICDGNELRYVTEVIQSGWLTTAGKCVEFEKSFAEKLGARFACAVNSATAALHLACEAVGIGRGDKVFVPTLTFTATAEVIRYLGGDPVFLDIEYGTGLVTPEIIENAISACPEAKALIVVHFGGQAADMNGIKELCKRNGLVLIEDAAHAFPARYDGRMVGADSQAACFSFYANKTITTGEGGMLVTDDESIYKRAKIMRLHGIDRDIWDRFTAEKPQWEYDVVAPGYKYNLPDVAAAIGLAQLERAEELRKQRMRCVEFYFKELENIECLDLPICRGEFADHAWHLFWVVLNQKCPVGRDYFIQQLNDSGIGTSVHYKPLHRMTYYRERYKLNPIDYPSAEKHWKGVVTLPVYPSLTDDELAYVCKTIRRVVSID